MTIVVFSCDKNDETFEAFHHCMEKYYPDHPEVVYFTETVMNPFYRTVTRNYDLPMWTKRIRESLSEIEDDTILMMIDDCFIRRPVDAARIRSGCSILTGNSNAACINFEKSFDDQDLDTPFEGFKLRKHGSPYEVSLMCGLWDKQKLLKVLERDCDPWTIELQQQSYGFDYYINSGDYIIDWGYRTWHPTNIFKGKWCRDVVPFFETEGITINYEKKGFR